MLRIEEFINKQIVECYSGCFLQEYRTTNTKIHKEFLVFHFIKNEMKALKKVKKNLY